MKRDVTFHFSPVKSDRWRKSNELEWRKQFRAFQSWWTAKTLSLLYRWILKKRKKIHHCNKFPNTSVIFAHQIAIQQLENVSPFRGENAACTTWKIQGEIVYIIYKISSQKYFNLHVQVKCFTSISCNKCRYDKFHKIFRICSNVIL